MSANPPLRILYVGYPLLAITEASCGGAEQMLRITEAGLSARGHRTTIAACAGSQAAGEAVETGPASGGNGPSDFEARSARHHERVVELVNARAHSQEPFDIIHDHSGLFWKCAGELAIPVLATLHLGGKFYGDRIFLPPPRNLFFNCVSQAQHRSFAGIGHLHAVVPNGIELERFAFSERKGEYLLWMGRICEEKGPHTALDIAARTRRRIVVAGAVYPFEYHQQYFEREIAPRLAKLGDRASFVEAPDFDRKAHLLSDASAVLIPSTVEESSSLVAMEALACGTPVIAFRRGALPEVVEHGVAGYIADSEEEMAEAVREVAEIDPHVCREYARQRFCSERMVSAYESIYHQLIAMHAAGPRSMGRGL